MKKSRLQRIFLLSVLVLSAIFAFSSCNKDDEGGGDDGTVEVNTDGTVSGNHVFKAIDESNFYIDHVKYTITYNHVEVTGYEEGALSGAVNIIPVLNYKGTTYQVIRIARIAFKNCDAITSVVIPNTIREICTGAFSYCDAITSISIPSSVTEIGIDSFVGCTHLISFDVDKDNTEYSSRDGVIFNKDVTCLYLCPCGREGAYTIPSTVTEINGLAFALCKKLTGVTIPNSVTLIGGYAFMNCISLTSFTVPKSVMEIGNAALQGSGVKELIYEEGCTKVFSTRADSVTSVIIPGTVKEIADNALMECRKLKSINIPYGVTKIGYLAFYSTGLTSVSIPSSVTEIGEWAFNNCGNLASVSIPSSVTKIGDCAFSQCYDLKDVTCLAQTPPEAHQNAFDCWDDERLHVPSGCKDVYAETVPWRMFKTILDDAQSN